MTAATASSPPGHPRSRRLGQLGTALDWRLDRLQAEYLHGSPPARADLARLRRALGKPAGSVPEVWEYTVGAVPESLRWDRDEPSRAEQAAHAALTLFAMHQQSMPVPAHVHGVSLGRAVGQLAAGGEQSADAVTRRFMAVATATSVDEALVHIRGLVAQLRSAQRGFDYARLADDLVKLLNPERAETVRLAWGRDFYRTRPVSTDTPETHDTTEETSTP
jgi:CRISPR system Cascade subunit CasB